MNSLFDVNPDSIAKAKKLLESDDENPPKNKHQFGKTKFNFAKRVNNLYHQRSLNIPLKKEFKVPVRQSQAVKIIDRKNSFENRVEIMPRPKKRVKKSVNNSELGSKEKKSKYLFKNMIKNSKSTSQSLYNKMTDKMRLETIDKVKNILECDKKESPSQLLLKIDKISSILIDFFEDELIFSRNFAPPDLKTYIFKKAPRSTQPSQSWIIHHHKMINHKISLYKRLLKNKYQSKRETQSKTSNLTLVSQNSNRTIKTKWSITTDHSKLKNPINNLIKQQIAFRFWREFKDRSESCISKILSRELPTQGSYIFKICKFKIADNGEFSIVLTDGWYCLEHLFMFKFEDVDWKKLLMSGHDSLDDLPAWRRILFEGKGFRGKTRKWVNSAEEENSLWNEVLIMKLILEGKLFVGLKIMITGFEFFNQEVKDETDLETHEKDNKIKLNYNNICPLKNQNTKLGQFTEAQRPVLLKVKIIFISNSAQLNYILLLNFLKIKI